MCLRLARHWQDRFDQTLMVWAPEAEELADAFGAVSGLRVVHRPSHAHSRLQQFRWCRDVILRDRPDAVVMHCFGVPHLIVALAARVAGIRAVGVWAGNPPPCDVQARWRFAGIVAVSRAIGCPIASCSGAVERELRALGRGLPRRSRVLSNGLDVADIRVRSERSRHQRRTTGPVIGMVSRLDPIKDHATLLKAFSILLEHVPAAELWIVGDGSRRAELEDMARDLGVSGSTRFFGNRPDVPELLGEMDVFAFSTTRDEGFGIALIEAMAARLPIVASNVAACREVLAGGRAGRLVQAQSASELAAALEHAIAHPAKWLPTIDAATHRIEREYSVAACGKAWEDILFPARKPNHTVAECAP